MTRYFFQTHYDGATVVDEIGEEFATAQEAEAHASQGPAEPLTDQR
jgi:hypothetical protein